MSNLPPPPPPKHKPASPAPTAATKFTAWALAFAGSSKSAAQLVAKQTERTKLTQITLPNAYRALGRHVHSQGRFRAELTDAYKKIDALLANIAKLTAAGPQVEGFKEKAKAVAKAANDKTHAQALTLKLNHEYTELGKATFHRYREKSGPTDVVKPILDSRARLEKLAAEMAELSKSDAGTVLTPKRIAIGGLSVVALLLILAVVMAFIGGKTDDRQLAKTEVAPEDAKLPTAPVEHSLADAKDRAHGYRDSLSKLRESMDKMSRGISEKHEADMRRAQEPSTPPKHQTRETDESPYPTTASPAPSKETAPRPRAPEPAIHPTDRRRPDQNNRKPDSQPDLPKQRQIFVLSTEETAPDTTLSDAEGELISCVAFSPDGSQALTGGADGAIYLWDVKSRMLVKRLETHKGRVNAAAFLSPGKQIISVGNDGLIHLWDLTSDQSVRLGQSPDDECLALAVSQDGTHAVTGGKDKKVSFWDLTQRKLTNAVPQNDHVVCVAMSSDGKRVVSGCRDGVVRTWNSDGGVEIGHFDEHKSSVVAVAMSPDGRMAASSSETDTDLPLWDVQTNKVLRRYDAQNVKQVTFTHDGTHLLTRSTTVQLWHVAFMPPLVSISSCDNQEISGIAVAPDDRSALVSARYVASVAPLPSLTARDDFPDGELASFPRRPGGFAGTRDVSYGVSDDGSRVITGWGGGWDDEKEDVVTPGLVLWDAKSGLQLECYEGATIASPKCQWIGYRLVRREQNSNDVGFSLRIVHTSGNVPPQNISGLLNAQWSSDETLVHEEGAKVVVSRDGRFLFVMGATRELVTKELPPGVERAPAFLRQKVVCRPRNIWWDVEQGQEIRRESKEQCHDGDFSPDNQHMLIWTSDGTRLISFRDGKTVSGVPVVSTGMLSGDGCRLVGLQLGRRTLDNRPRGEYWKGRNEVGMWWDGRRATWEISSGRMISEFECPDEYIVSRVSFDGTRLACQRTPGNGSISVVDANTGRIIRRLERTGGGGICFTPDGTHVLVGGNSRLEYWNVDKEVLVQSFDARSRLARNSVADYGKSEVEVLPGGRFAFTVNHRALVLWKLPK